MNAWGGLGLFLIMATEWCFLRARRQQCNRWEARARFLQAGVIVVYGVIVYLSMRRA